MYPIEYVCMMICISADRQRVKELLASPRCKFAAIAAKQTIAKQRVERREVPPKQTVLTEPQKREREQAEQRRKAERERRERERLNQRCKRCGEQMPPLGQSRCAPPPVPPSGTLSLASAAHSPRARVLPPATLGGSHGRGFGPHGKCFWRPP